MSNSLADGKGSTCKSFLPASPEEPDWLVHFDLMPGGDVDIHRER